VEANNIGFFYRFVNKRTVSRSGIGPVAHDSGNLVFDDQIKATMFNNYFATVGTVDHGKIQMRKVHSC